MSLPPGWRPQPPEEKPGVIPLRPIGVGELLGATFTTVRRCWQPLAAVSAAVATLVIVVLLPIALAARPLLRAYLDLVSLDVGATPSTSQTEDALRSVFHELAAFTPWLLLYAVLMAVAFMVIEAGSAIVTSNAVLGRDVPPGDVLVQVWRLLPRLIGLALIMGISIVAGLMLCIIPGLVLAVFWFAAAPALVLEPASITGALGRSWHLVQGAFWRVLGIVLLVQLLLGLAVQFISSPLSILGSANLLNGGPGSIVTEGQLELFVATYLVTVAITLFLYPFGSIARTLLYLDLRMRKENLASALASATKGVKI
jgi:hypothetical protein